VPAQRTRRRRAVPDTSAIQQLGERIRAARTEAGLSQAQLGAPYYTRAHVSAIELGKIRPAMKSLEHIAAKLGKPVSYFLEDAALETERGERQVALVRAAQLTAEGKASEAIDLLRPLLIQEQVRSDRAAVLRALGRAYWEAGLGSKAASVLQDALDIYQGAHDLEQIARTRAQLGMALHLLMSYPEAAEHLSEALRAVARGEVRDPLFKVHVLHNLGLTFYQRNEFSVALEHFERAENEGADIGDPKWLASLFAAIGMSRYQLKDFDSAVAYLGKSEALFESIRNKSRAAEIRFLRAKTLRALGHREKGAKTLREAHDLASDAGNTVLETRISINSALARVEDGAIDEGIAALRASVKRTDEIGERSLRVAARVALARATKTQDPSEAEMALREAMEMMRDRPGPELGEVYAEISDVMSRKGLAEEALQYSRKAFEVSRQ